MTLDEAIKHEEEVVEVHEKEAKECHKGQVRKCELFPFLEMDYTYENAHKEAADEHRQLVEWLKELKQLREQQFVLDDIRDEVNQYGSIWVQYTIKGHTDKDIDDIIKNVLKQAKEQMLSVIDKYRNRTQSDCRYCKEYENCPCGKDGHENGTSQGYSTGECKYFKLKESEE